MPRSRGSPTAGEQVAHQHAVLVDRAPALGLHPPVCRSDAAVVEAEHGVGVADVDRQEHGGCAIADRCQRSLSAHASLSLRFVAVDDR